eukprot:CAMPEP_0185545056 /NCGR_PEP_ID=MMETSP1381-20130426/4492_1 /TAXON_ID=298111 /ORGANISM="Pavlova sp., Strain CCMP459" /LENGTH=67 /DNA_ID=CAMNT_0028157333 /DNA_START=808 /DNA_END=1008 /DNA_ORIENTATION=-
MRKRLLSAQCGGVVNAHGHALRLERMREELHRFRRRLRATCCSGRTASGLVRPAPVRPCGAGAHTGD